MAIKTGRNGSVRWDPTPTSPASPGEIISLNAWTLSLRTDFEDVSCFGDTNKVYVPGLRDVSGTVGGFLNLDELTLIHASAQDTPGLLELVPNTDDESPSGLFSGPAYLDVDISCSLSAPKITGSFKAGGAWVLP